MTTNLNILRSIRNAEDRLRVAAGDISENDIKGAHINLIKALAAVQAALICLPITPVPPTK